MFGLIEARVDDEAGRAIGGVDVGPRTTDDGLDLLGRTWQRLLGQTLCDGSIVYEGQNVRLDGLHVEVAVTGSTGIACPAKEVDADEPGSSENL